MEKKKRQTEDLVDGFKTEETELLWRKKKSVQGSDDEEDTLEENEFEEGEEI